MDEAWLISLDDDGPGFSTRCQQVLREGRVDDVAADGPGGKGLPIVMRALSGIGGTIRIESDPSKVRAGPLGSR